MITFQVESLEQWYADLGPLVNPHWSELTLDQDLCIPELDIERARQADAQGVVLIVTVRDSGKLVGYWVGLLLTHLHYRNAGLMCHTDMYFLLPEYRKGGTGAKMLAFVETEIRKRGVVKAYISCKVHQDHTELFEAMGWRMSDHVFIKRF